MAHSHLGNALQRARFLQPGDKLGKHDLIRQIAVGGMAELYLARTVGIEGFEKLAVVKRILPQYAANASFVHMFLNEARLAATFHHPNIAQVYDIGQEQGEFFFSMEYVHGEDLGRLVMTGIEQGIPISLDAALTLAAGLCAGLHHAHEKVSPDGKPLNVVHRDVSPSNVLVSYDGAVKLVDFGIARVNSTPTSTAGGLKGKISYMSPEQCRGKVSLDRRSDIFSIGTIMYEMTTGRLPFTDETEYGILNQIVTCDAEPPSKLVPGYPPALEAILMKALAREPDQRYSTALEMQGQIEDFAHENRLRVSPLVLARLMSTLFPARLEEWDHARAQGAFFVEQHVVRTLIESGKTGESATVSGDELDDGPHESTNLLPAVAGETARDGDDDDSTAVTAPPIAPDDDQTAVRQPMTERPHTPPPTVRLPGVHERARTPIPARALTPVPVAQGTMPGVAATALALPLPPEPSPQFARAPTPYPRAPTPVPGMPGAVPIYAPLPPPNPGTLVSNPNPSSAAPALHVGDVTERVRVPTPVVFTQRSRKPILVLVLALTGAAAAALVTYLVLSSGSGEPPQITAVDPPKTVMTTEPPDPKPEVKEPEPEPKPKAVVKPAVVAKPKPEPAIAKAVEVKPPVVVAKPIAKAVEVKPPVVVAKPKPVEAKPLAKVEPKPKPKPKDPKVTKPEPKEPQWSGDSPFLPVREKK